MSKSEREDRCSDLLQMLIANVRSYCVSYGLDWTDVCANDRVRAKKNDKDPGKSYKHYHDLQNKLLEHNIRQEGMITWPDLQPLALEMEQLAGDLVLEK